MTCPCLGVSVALSLSLIAAAASFQPSFPRGNAIVPRGVPSFGSYPSPPPPANVGVAIKTTATTSPIRPSSHRHHRPAAIGASSTSLAAVAPAAAALSAIGSPLGSIAVLAFVILVHEAGHFIAARSLGISVEEFSVGVGPRLVGVRRRLVDDEFVFERIDESAGDASAEGDERVYEPDDGIEFSLRALPIGGYVRFPENYNRTLAFEAENVSRKARNEARLMRLEGASALEKALESVAAKSFVLNLASLGLIKRWQKGRQEDQLRRAEEESASALSSSGNKGGNGWLSALPWASKKEENDDLDGGDTLAILKAAKEPEIDYFQDPNLLQNRPWQERAVVLSGGVAFNILLAFAIYFGELTGGKGLPRPVFNAGSVISQVPGKDSPSFGLLKQGDVVLGVNQMITSAAKTSNSDVWSSQRAISDVISAIRETPDGESVKLTIRHGRDGDATDTVTVTPRRNDQGVASIGVMLGPNYSRTEVVRASNLVDGVAKAGSAVYELTSETARSVFGLLIGLVLGKGPPAGTSMSGPIGVVKTGAEVVRSSDLGAVVAFAASISINLAVVNSLPLPALDGGQLAFVLAEAAAGRRIDQRVQEGINAGALLILLFISFGTAVGDVTSIFR